MLSGDQRDQGDQRLGERLRHGKIVNDVTVLDRMGLMEQLGQAQSPTEV